MLGVADLVMSIQQYGWKDLGESGMMEHKNGLDPVQ
jgi:hypothetical protein